MVTAAMTFYKDNAVILVVPGIFQFTHFATGHLLYRFGKRLVVRKVDVVAPGIVQIFGRCFFGNSQHLEKSLVAIHSRRLAIVKFNGPQTNACT